MLFKYIIWSTEERLCELSFELVLAGYGGFDEASEKMVGKVLDK